MPAQLLARIRLREGNPVLDSFLKPLVKKIPKFPQTQALIFRMVAQSGSTKRPTCPSCSKPTRICLCNRLKTPTLHNSVSVTILQHSLEKKHPLNSTRIATLGLKNVNVVTVSDVNFQAQFIVSLLESSRPVKLENTCHLFDEMLGKGECDDFVDRKITENMKPATGSIDVDRQLTERCDFEGAEICDSGTILTGNSGLLVDRGLHTESCPEEVMNKSNESTEVGIGEEIVASKSVGTCFDRKEVVLECPEATTVSFTIEKYGVIRSFNHCHQMSLDRLLAFDTAFSDTRKGFVVRKLHRKRLEESTNEYEENQEFDLEVPPGSVLLFPSERSIDVGAIDFEVKNLIVLDGTWAKAKRMYNENPWLKLLPHIRLELDKLSLYSEVRHQPRAGYLSTIESIVYALKAVGEEDSRGLDGLLDVFESMVGDQRRCKNERLSRGSE